MASANVFNLNSVKQSQVLNANAVKGRSKADNQEAAGVFASLMNGNYSTNMPTASVNITNSVQGTTAAADFDRYQYRDNSISKMSDNVVSDKIKNSSEELGQFQKEVVQTVADELGVTEDSVKEAMEELGLTAFDLLNPENLAQLSMTLLGENSSMDLLMNDQFQGLMQSMDELGAQLMDTMDLLPDQMDELVAQMDILESPQTLTEEQLQDLTGSAGEQQSEDYASIGTIPERAEETTNLQQADVQEKQPQADEVRTQAATNDTTNDQNTGNQTDSENDSQLLGERSSDTVKTPENTKTQTEANVSFQMNEAAAEIPAEANVVSENSYVSIDTLDLLQQVAEQIRVNVAEGTSSMEMQLNPENLGKIYVNISMKEGAIHAQLAASNEAVRAALETQVADLRQNLDQAGVKVDAVEVTVASHEFEKNLEQNQEGAKQQGERQQEQASRRRSLNLSSLDELSGLMTEEEVLAAQIMRDNGNSVDMTA